MPDDLYALAPTDEPLRFRWAPAPLLLTPMGTLQGGAGLGAAVTALEAVTGRPLIWATAQYLSYAAGSEAVDVDVTVEVAGHNTTQGRCVVSRHGREILTAHAALGSRDLDVAGVWPSVPDVPDPDHCEPYGFFGVDRGHIGTLTEFRLAHGRQVADLAREGGRGDGWLALWVRAWQGEHRVTVPDLTFLGDFMPIAFGEALGAPYAGQSLDNTIRVGQLVTTGWVLLSAHVTQVVRGFGYGRAELWSQDGTLLGEVSQSAVIRMLAL